jgi:hypothetical protein
MSVFGSNDRGIIDPSLETNIEEQTIMTKCPLQACSWYINYVKAKTKEKL